MAVFLNEQSCVLEEYYKQPVRRLIEKVTIQDNRIEVEFKSSMSVDVER
jgi:site-specific DNA recombinase